MSSYAFETVDVFTEQRFGGNPLAVFTDARGISDAEMQALAFEFNLSETTFVLPPADPANSARVRIFNRTVEMAFAGHPSIGTAYVLARNGHPHGDRLRLEVPAGIVAVEIERDNGVVIGGKITAPQPLATGQTFTPDVIAQCLGIPASDIITSAHPPMVASVGNAYVFIELKPDAVARCTPDIRAFRTVLDANAATLNGRFALYVYARNGAEIHARMFAPLAGTWEDPATGSAATPLAGLLLQADKAESAAYTIRQGAEMRRPSTLHVTARREGANIISTVAGRCVPVFRGEVQL